MGQWGYSPHFARRNEPIYARGWIRIESSPFVLGLLAAFDAVVPAHPIYLRGLSRQLIQYVCHNTDYRFSLY